MTIRKTQSIDTEIGVTTTTVVTEITPFVASARPPRPTLEHVARSFAGGLVSIAALGILQRELGSPLILGSFGATCVLVFGYPDSPFSQPRNVVLGHLLSSTTGVAFVSMFGVTWWSTALALATSLALMQLTRTVHPPAGSNPIIAMLSQASWPFVVRPTLLGAVIVCLIAVVFHRVTAPRESYPKYWF
jgi:CBS-domain-containing membrane protein